MKSAPFGAGTTKPKQLCNIILYERSKEGKNRIKKGTEGKKKKKKKEGRREWEEGRREKEEGKASYRSV